MTETAAEQRLFFALWPAPEVQQALAERGRELLGRRRARTVPRANLHITLAFLGEVGVDTRSCAERVAGDLHGEAFDLAIDQLGYWGRRGLLWAGPSETPPALERLAADLGSGLETCGIPRETRPFRPHVTLARKAPRLPALTSVEPVAWPVRRFVLVESRLGQGGAVYTEVAHWPLAE